MKKNTIIIISILIVFVAVLVAVMFIKVPEKTQPTPNTPTIDAATDIENDLQDLDVGNLDKEFEAIDKDIESL